MDTGVIAQGVIAGREESRIREMRGKGRVAGTIADTCTPKTTICGKDGTTHQPIPIHHNCGTRSIFSERSLVTIICQSCEYIQQPPYSLYCQDYSRTSILLLICITQPLQKTPEITVNHSRISSHSLGTKINH